LIYAAFRAWKTLRRYFISLPSKTAFYCVTKSREPTTNESDVFSVLACTLFVSVDDKLVSILPYHRKAKAFRTFFLRRDIIMTLFFRVNIEPRSLKAWLSIQRQEEQAKKIMPTPSANGVGASH